MNDDNSPQSSKPTPVTPELALDLRLRFLESLVCAHSNIRTSSSPSIARRIARIESQLQQAFDQRGSTDAIRRFVHNYELNSPLLSLAPIALPALDSTELTIPAKVELILEAEHDLTTLERDLREISVLEQRGVVEAGNLPEHEPLKGPLERLVDDTKPVAAEYATLEARTTSLLQKYNNYISDLSELFVTWDDLLTDAEQAVTKLEKQRDATLDFA
ncbi:uncharacterized protein JCM15063_002156 [Sporobolomyces koalae]|uniref:uncharacterized protein n=1 Tax=Sporobolomyces koalae TaxID=500713 RepID=UPI0031727FE2